MAKTSGECNKIYRSQWIDKKSGYRFRLDMIPSYDAMQSSPTVVNLPEGVIIGLDYGWEFDKWYIGAPKAPTMNISYDLGMLDGGSSAHDFNVFARLLADSQVDISFSEVLDLGSFTIEFTAGNLWILYVDIAGGSTFVPQFMGMQMAKSEEEIDVTALTYDIEIVDLGKAIMDSIPTAYLSHLWAYRTDGDMYYNNITVDAVWESSDNKTTANYNKCGLRSWFHPIKTFENYIETHLIEPIFKRIRRDSSVNVYLSIDIGDYYKQKYDASGSRGAALAYTDLNFMPYVTTFDDPGAYAFDPIHIRGGMLEYLREEYKTLWDWMNDLAIASGSYLFTVYFDDVDAQKIWIYHRNLFTAADITIASKDIFELKLQPNKNKVKQVTVTPIEQKSVGIDKLELPYTDVNANQGSRNDERMEIPVLYHNMPVWSDKLKTLPDSLAGYTEGGGGLSEANIIFGHIKKTIRTRSVHETGLYYIERPEKPLGGYLTKDRRPIRAYENVNLDFGDSIDSDGLVSGTIEGNSQKNQPLSHKTDAINEKGILWNTGKIGRMQQHGCLPYILGMAYYYLFNHTGQIGLTLKTLMSVAAYNDRLLWFNPQDYNLEIDLPTVAPITDMFDTFKTRYLITKMNLKLVTGDPNTDGDVELELLSRYE